jgi:hypothetical protein
MLCQLPDTRKTQLAVLLRARIVFTELLPGNELIKYATVLYYTILLHYTVLYYSYKLQHCILLYCTLPQCTVPYIPIDKQSSHTTEEELVIPFVHNNFLLKVFFL